MTPEQYCNCFMSKLWSEKFFETTLTTKQLLAEKVLDRLKIIQKFTGVVYLTEEDLENCLRKATEAYINQALIKFSEKGLLTVWINENGTIKYRKNILCLKNSLNFNSHV